MSGFSRSISVGQLFYALCIGLILAAGQQRSEQRNGEQRGFVPASSAQPQDVQGLDGIPGFQLPSTAAYQGQSRPHSRQQGAARYRTREGSAVRALLARKALASTVPLAPSSSAGSPSALVRPRAVEKHTPAPMAANARNFSWPGQRQHPHQHKQQPYGASFEGLFSQQQPADAQSGAAARAGSGGATGAQPSDPVLLVQCGRFTAPVQRETALQQQGTQQHAQPAGWPSLHASSGPSASLRPSKVCLTGSSQYTLGARLFLGRHCGRGPGRAWFALPAQGTNGHRHFQPCL